MEQDLDQERHCRRAFEDLANSLLRVVGLCGLTSKDLSFDNPDREKLIQQRVHEITSWVGERVSLTVQVAHQAELLARLEHQVADVKRLEQECMEQTATIQRLQDDRINLQQERDAATERVRGLEMENISCKEQIHQTAALAADAQERAQALENQVNNVGRERVRSSCMLPFVQPHSQD